MSFSYAIHFSWKYQKIISTILNKFEFHQLLQSVACIIYIFSGFKLDSLELIKQVKQNMLHLQQIAVFLT